MTELPERAANLSVVSKWIQKCFKRTQNRHLLPDAHKNLDLYRAATAELRNPALDTERRDLSLIHCERRLSLHSSSSSLIQVTKSPGVSRATVQSLFNQGAYAMRMRLRILGLLAARAWRSERRWPPRRRSDLAASPERSPMPAGGRSRRHHHRRQQGQRCHPHRGQRCGWQLPDSGPRSGPLHRHRRAAGLPEGRSRRRHRSCSVAPSISRAVLKVGSVTEVVNVTGDTAKQIDLTSVTIQHNVTAEEFDRMPKARTFQDVALTAPVGQQGRHRGRLPGQRRERRRERLHRRRRGDQQPDQRLVPAEHRVRVPPGSTGQDDRHPGRVRWRPRWRRSAP